MHEIKTLTVVFYREFRDRHEEVKKKKQKTQYHLWYTNPNMFLAIWPEKKKLGKFEIDVQC